MAYNSGEFMLGGIGARGSKRPTLICFSHLRWDFVYQRPQHLMSRFAQTHEVLYWEEPLFADGLASPELKQSRDPANGVMILTPQLPAGLAPDACEAALAQLLAAQLGESATVAVRWYYTPMMLPFSRDLSAECTVYDCMDELSAFKFAPPELLALETELLACADLVFTGGYSLYDAKRGRHPQVHPFPSGVDREHFATARNPRIAASDQAALAGPKLGYYGVIDERIDLDLLAQVADLRPDWQLVMVGPVVKISPDDLPRRANIHYLGGREYAQLPAYLAGWDVAMMPFARNEATRYISPTKTPEYLAGGKPVVSTPIVDVVRHYGEMQGVVFAEDAPGFVAAVEQALALAQHPGTWLPQVDSDLSRQGWDAIFARMSALIARASGRPALRAVEAAAAKPAYDYLIVGAGFAGSVLAERLASQHGARVLVVDKRPHIGGNAFDCHDQAGILIHQYGPHIFHTNSDEILAYLSRFTAWRPYEHRVLAQVRDKLLPIPINRTTLNRLFELDLADDEDAAAYLASRAEPVDTIRTSEDVVVSTVGRELYELFFQGYTRKQWGVDPSGLDKSVTARIPTRTNTDDRYFGDKHQCMPRDGYTAMFERMLDHPNITLALGTDFAEIRKQVKAEHIIYSGPIDEYFDYRFGKLPYRSLRFDHRTVDQQQFQPVAVVNYPAPETPYTRITEYKHLTGQEHEKTSITYEYPGDEGDPYYPVPRAENEALYKQYEALAKTTPGVTFVGRLGTYRYYNMDQVVGQALAVFRRIDAARKQPMAAKVGREEAHAS